MMPKRHWAWGMRILVVAFLLGRAGWACLGASEVPVTGDKSVPEKSVGALRETKTVRLIITEQYENAPSLHISLVQKGPEVLLRAAGVKVVTGAEEPAEATLKMQIRGKALQHKLESGLAYSGAEIKGEFEFSTSQGPLLQKEFIGRVAPDSEEGKGFFIARSPERAPFARALINSGYVSRLGDAISALWKKDKVALLSADLYTEEDDYFLWGAAFGLAELGERGIPPLEHGLGHPRRTVGQACALGLGRAGNPGLVVLRKVLTGRDPIARPVAALGLGWAHDSASLDLLIRSLKDNSPGMRHVAANALREIADPRAVSALAIALKDQDEDFRAMAARALEAIGQPAAEPLVTALADEDPYVRTIAAGAFKKIKSPAAVEPLIARLKDKNTDVRVAAIEALTAIKDSRAFPALIALWAEDDLLLLGLVSKGLAEIGPPAVDALLMALKDKEPLVRENAAHTLGEIGDPRAVEPLALLAEKDPNLMVQVAAEHALGKIRVEKPK